MRDASRVETPLLIAFADLTHYAVNSSRSPDAEVADLLDGWYEIVGARAASAGGRIVKFIGDAALIVFPEETSDAGVRALVELRREAEEYFSRNRWDSRLVVKAHFGVAVAGPFGARGDKNFDIIGNAVNVAATLQSRGFAISPEAFRKLEPETRRLFKKHTPPVSYIPVEDRRP